jgi:periplasmic divalent cation tolerance protein
MANYIQVITTVEKQADGLALARLLVERHLAGCVQVIGPITSVYRWRGAIETTGEWLCLIKSREDLYEALEATVREAHPYEVPELLALPVVKGNSDYLEWLDDALRQQ